MARKSAVALSLLLSLAIVASAANVPLMFWSGNSAFAAQKQYHTEKLSGKNVGDILTSLVSGSASKGLFSALSQKPEIVVVFVQPKASSSQIARLAAFAPLKNSFATAAASVAATGVSVESSSDMTKAINAASNSLYAEGGRIVRINSADSIESLSEIASNGRTDMIIVSLVGSAEEASHAVERIYRAVSEEAGAEHVVAVFTAVESADIQQDWQQPEWAKRYILADAPVVVDAPSNVSAPTNYSAPSANNNVEPGFSDYFPAWFWEGFVVGIIFVWIAICGSCALMDMQTPDRFLTGDVKKKNE